jgi:hypothetical protein
MKDTLVETFKRSGSISNILKTGRSLVTDAYENMDWDGVRQRILNHAAQEGVEAALLAGLNQVFDNLDAGILDGLMNNVSFDFTPGLFNSTQPILRSKLPLVIYADS